MTTDNLEEFVGKMLGDLGAGFSASLVLMGDRLGLFSAMNGAGPMTSQSLSEKTNTEERYCREWLAAMAASGYVDLDPENTTFTLSPVQAQVFDDPGSPYYMQGSFECMESNFLDESKVRKAFKEGGGVGWGDHSSCLFSGVERFFRPSYDNMLVQAWLPALDGIVEKLERGMTVADVGCGGGYSTRLLAKAFPKSTFVGFDYHAESITAAIEEADAAGITNATFKESSAQQFDGEGYGLVCFFDCLHDMGDPVGALRRAKETMADDGVCMLVEPFAQDNVKDNMNPVGRI
ncbi:MAG: 2-polyprenyl-3-methyl-5-hydroxy-6-metoxy-1,4-benzoquinol methylase [Acidimicrobiales bacterium]|jgi:2-polyprenyl-3-methyl-5-hydroxy-6-metoxy-1,4-benzoquinol methylase